MSTLMMVDRKAFAIRIFDIGQFLANI